MRNSIELSRISQQYSSKDSDILLSIFFRFPGVIVLAPIASYENNPRPLFFTPQSILRPTQTGPYRWMSRNSLFNITGPGDGTEVGQWIDKATSGQFGRSASAAAVLWDEAVQDPRYLRFVARYLREMIREKLNCSERLATDDAEKGRGVEANTTTGHNATTGHNTTASHNATSWDNATLNVDPDVYYVCSEAFTPGSRGRSAPTEKFFEKSIFLLRNTSSQERKRILRRLLESRTAAATGGTGGPFGDQRVSCLLFCEPPATSGVINTNARTNEQLSFERIVRMISLHCRWIILVENVCIKCSISIK